MLIAGHCTTDVKAENIKLFVGDNNWKVDGDGEQLVRVKKIIKVLYFFNIIIVELILLPS